MDSASAAILLVLGMVALANYRNHTLGAWLGAKFLNRVETPDLGAVGGGNFTTPSTAPPKVAGFTGLGNPLGTLIPPVAGATVTGSFGDARAGHTHAGIDLAAPTGTPIDAAAPGRVTYAGPSSGYGLRVDIDHGNGAVTRYGHLSRIGVKLGQVVAGGAVIGQVGSTGDATGPHLHFELRENGTAVNPAPYLGSLGRSA